MRIEVILYVMSLALCLVSAVKGDGLQARQTYSSEVVAFAQNGDVARATDALIDLRQLEALRLDVLQTLLLIDGGKASEAKAKLKEVINDRASGPKAKDFRDMVTTFLAFVCMSPIEQPVVKTQKDLLSSGLGWVRIDASKARKDLGLSAQAELRVKLSGSGLAKDLIKEVVIEGEQKEVDIAFWSGAAHLVLSDKKRESVRVADIDIEGWSESPVTVNQTQAEPMQKVGQTFSFDDKTKVLHWGQPNALKKDSYRFRLWIARKDKEWEVFCSRYFAQSVRSVALQELNQKVGPMVPEMIDITSRQYVATIVPVDETDKQVGEAATLVFGNNDLVVKPPALRGAGR